MILYGDRIQITSVSRVSGEKAQVIAEPFVRAVDRLDRETTMVRWQDADNSDSWHNVYIAFVNAIFKRTLSGTRVVYRVSHKDISTTISFEVMKMIEFYFLGHLQG